MGFVTLTLTNFDPQLQSQPWLVRINGLEVNHIEYFRRVNSKFTITNGNQLELWLDQSEAGVVPPNLRTSIMTTSYFQPPMTAVTRLLTLIDKLGFLNTSSSSSNANDSCRLATFVWNFQRPSTQKTNLKLPTAL